MVPFSTIFNYISYRDLEDWTTTWVFFCYRYNVMNLNTYCFRILLLSSNINLKAGFNINHSWWVKRNMKLSVRLIITTYKIFRVFWRFFMSIDYDMIFCYIMLQKYEYEVLVFPHHVGSLYARYCFPSTHQLLHGLL